MKNLLVYLLVFKFWNQKFVCISVYIEAVIWNIEVINVWDFVCFFVVPGLFQISFSYIIIETHACIDYLTFSGLKRLQELDNKLNALINGLKSRFVSVFNVFFPSWLLI